MRRVDEAMRAVLSEAISKDLQDPRVGFVTVTGVKTSPDLRHARVFTSACSATTPHGRRVSTACSSAHGFLQGRVAHALRLKHTPTLTFDYDESVDRGMRITELLAQTHGRDGGRAESDDARAIERTAIRVRPADAAQDRCSTPCGAPTS